MATKNYIPSNNKDFMSFQSNLDAQVTANAVAWNIPAAEATALNTWSTGYGPLFNAIVNENTRTREQVIAHDTYRADYEAFLRSFCQGFLVNNMLIPISERVAMGLNPRGLNPPSKRPKILTAPIPSLFPLGGGMVKFSFKVAESNKRIARHPDSNGVEVFYKLETLAEPAVVLNDALVEEAEPAEEQEDHSGFENVFSTRAQFVKKLGLEHVGKRLTVYARWVNTSDSEKNSQCCNAISMVVS